MYYSLDSRVFLPIDMTQSRAIPANVFVCLPADALLRANGISSAALIVKKKQNGVTQMTMNEKTTVKIDDD